MKSIHLVVGLDRYAYGTHNEMCRLHTQWVWWQTFCCFLFSLRSSLYSYKKKLIFVLWSIDKYWRSRANPWASFETFLFFSCPSKRRRGKKNLSPNVCMNARPIDCSRWEKVFRKYQYCGDRSRKKSEITEKERKGKSEKDSKKASLTLKKNDASKILIGFPIRHNDCGSFFPKSSSRLSTLSLLNSEQCNLHNSMGKGTHKILNVLVQIVIISCVSW